MNLTSGVICDTGAISRYVVGAEPWVGTMDNLIGLGNTFITPVIRIELYNWLSGFHTIKQPKRTAALGFIKGLSLLHLTEEISKLSIFLADKHINSKPGDVLIAATALHYSLPVYTLNKKDFRQLA